MKLPFDLVLGFVVGALIGLHYTAELAGAFPILMIIAAYLVLSKLVTK